MTDIYKQFDKAFSRVSAYAIIKDGDYVGRVVIKRPTDGAGRLTVFVHEWGTDAIKGTASGCGYDKVGAALFNAGNTYNKKNAKTALYEVLKSCGSGGRWEQVLENSGYSVLNVI